MPYSEEEIQRYINILHNLTKPPEKETGQKTRCRNCQRDDSFTIWSCYLICENCSVIYGNVLGYDKKDYERLHFRKKSIYQRKYHYVKKVDQVSKKLKLTEEEKYELFNKLMEINDNVMEIINKQFCRKRMISIFYLMKKILEERGNEKYKLINVNISDQTLAYYQKWWERYKLLNPSVKTPVNNSS